MDSFLELIDEINPTIICLLVETYLEYEDEINIKGYVVMALNRKSHGVGVLIAVKEELKNITVKIEEEMEDGEMIWILINNGQIAVKIGVVYLPQESRTKTARIKTIYKKIGEHCAASNKENQHLMVVGDFNCKIGDNIRGNNNKTTRREIVNTNAEKK